MFESKAMKDPNLDSTDIYMKLLICFVCERFVVISRLMEFLKQVYVIGGDIGTTFM